MDFSNLLHGFVKVVLCISRSLPNKTKTKFDRDVKACWSFCFELLNALDLLCLWQYFFFRPFFISGNRLVPPVVSCDGSDRQLSRDLRSERSLAHLLLGGCCLQWSSWFRPELISYLIGHVRWSIVQSWHMTPGDHHSSFFCQEGCVMGYCEAIVLW